MDGNSDISSLIEKNNTLTHTLENPGSRILTIGTKCGVKLMVILERAASESPCSISGTEIYKVECIIVSGHLMSWFV